MTDADGGLEDEIVVQILRRKLADCEAAFEDAAAVYFENERLREKVAWMAVRIEGLSDLLGRRAEKGQ